MSTTSKIWLIGICLIFVIGSIFRGCERIDAGSVGIKVNMTGGSQGISKTEYVTGWCFYWRLSQKVYEFPTFQQHKEYDPWDVPAKGGVVFTVHPMFNYNINAGEVGNMFARYRVGVSQLENGFIKTSMITAIREITNTFAPDSILNNQAGYDAAIYNKLTKELAPYFQITQFTANLIPDPKLKEAISEKAKAVQEAQAKIAQIAVTNANNQIEIAVAKKDSTVKIVGAQADAEAIKLKQMQITPIYVEYIKWVNATGDVPRVPTTVLGSGSDTFFNLK